MDMDVSTAMDGRSSSPLSEPEGNAPSPPVNNRRKSGRATRKPELFSQVSVDNNNNNAGAGTSTGGRSKRKRATPQDEDNEDEDEGEGEDEEEDGEDASDSSDESDGDPDEEELKEKKRKARRASSQKKKKPSSNAGKSKATSSRGARAAKKPKITNGFGTELAIRPAVNGKKTASKPKKARARPGQIVVEEDGLFGRNPLSIAVSINWLY
jgi:cohesin complex subunit SA-1/2